MGTFQLIQDLDYGDYYFWIQIPPCDATILKKSMWYIWYYGESCRYIFDESDLKEE